MIYLALYLIGIIASWFLRLFLIYVQHKSKDVFITLEQAKEVALDDNNLSFTIFICVFWPITIIIMLSYWITNKFKNDK